MNKGKLFFIKVIHSTICIYTLVYVLYATLNYGFNELSWTSLWPLLPLLAISFLFYFLTDRAWKYLVLEGVVLAGFLFAGEATEKTSVYVATFVLCFVLQTVEKRRNEELLVEPSWPFLVLFVLSYLYSVYSERTGVCQYLPYAMMIYMIITLLYLNEQGLGSFLEVRQNVKNQPLHQMEVNNGKIMALVLAGLGIVFVLLAMLTGDRLIWWLMAKFKEGFRRLMRQFFAWLGQQSDDGSVSYHSPSFEGHKNSAAMEYQDGSSAWLENIFMFLGYIIAMGLVLLAFYVMYRVVSRWILSYKNRKKPVVIDTDETMVDEVTWLRSEEKRKKTKMSGKTAEERVRMLYRQTILKERGKRKMQPPAPGMTPTDIETDSFASGSMPEGLHSLYEQARYSDIPVTEEEEKTLRKNME